MKNINTIFIANRGEIAVRIIRTAQKLGIHTVVAYAEDDSQAVFVEKADSAIPFHSSQLHETYLNIEKIIQIAKDNDCDAIHPGYGFLAENPKFAQACEKADILFVGPHAEAIRLMGNKIESRSFVQKIGIPLIKSYSGTIEELKKYSQEIPYPILIKAAAGGGGKGMRIVHDPKNFNDALETTAREAKNYFGDATVYIEQYLLNPRHIEVQILGDNHGNAIHLFERECSLQRRHQKIIEEAPSPTLTDELREQLMKDAIKIAKAIKYNNAGTIEFIFDANLRYYFLEMNTRIQVEHPVTEMITGLDIVEEQIRIAAGNVMSIHQNDLNIHGHAIECRVYAENPEKDFLPSPGKLFLYQEPEMENIRIDSGVRKGDLISGTYDPMISKLVGWSTSRKETTKLVTQALKSYHLGGPDNNLAYLLALLNNKDFVENKIHTTYCDQTLETFKKQLSNSRASALTNELILAYALYSMQQKQHDNIWNDIGFWRLFPSIPVKSDEKVYDVDIKPENNTCILSVHNNEYKATLISCNENGIEISLNGQNMKFSTGLINEAAAYIANNGFAYKMERLDILQPDLQYDEAAAYIGTDSDIIKSPMFGKIVKINVKAKDTVKEGDTLLILESMKMENAVYSHKNGTIKSILVSEGEQVELNKTLIELENKDE